MFREVNAFFQKLRAATQEVWRESERVAWTNFPEEKKEILRVRRIELWNKEYKTDQEIDELLDLNKMLGFD